MRKHYLTGHVAAAAAYTPKNDMQTLRYVDCTALALPVLVVIATNIYKNSENSL